MNEFSYTITSTDPNDYSRINVNLVGPFTEQIEFMITNLTTMCSFNVLTNDDYIKISYKDMVWTIFMYEISEIDKSKLTVLLNDRFKNIWAVGYGARSRLTIGTDAPFVIEDMSYNLSLVTGFYNAKFPIKSTEEYCYSFVVEHFQPTKFTTADYLEIDGIRNYFDNNFEIVSKYTLPVTLQSLQPDYMLPTQLVDETTIVNIRSNKDFAITAASPLLKKILKIYEFPTKSFRYSYTDAPSSGYFHLTPMLYLISNLGIPHYTYTDQNGINQRILMKIINRFKHGMPIAAFNIEYYSTINTSALSEAWFQLVDANFQPVKLLSPMYISAVAIGVEKKTEKIYLKE